MCLFLLLGFQAAQAVEPSLPDPPPIVKNDDRLKPHHLLIAIGWSSAYVSGVTALQYHDMVQERSTTTDAARYRQLSHQANGNLAAAISCGSLAAITLPLGLAIEF